MTPLIAEDLLLLLFDDEDGKPSPWGEHGSLIAGAVLAELALHEAVRIEKTDGFFERSVVSPVEPRIPLADPVLVEALDTIAEKDRPASSILSRLGKGLENRLADRLADRGVLRRQKSKVLGIFPRTRWPEADATREREIRTQLDHALIADAEPEPRTAVLVALLLAGDQVHQVVGTERRSKKELKARAEEVADGGWASEAVRKVIQNAQTAVLIAVAGGVGSGYAGS